MEALSRLYALLNEEEYFEDNFDPEPSINGIVGIDLGIRNLCCTSNGLVFQMKYIKGNKNWRKLLDKMVDTILFGTKEVVIEYIKYADLKRLGMATRIHLAFLWKLKHQAKIRNIAVSKVYPGNTSNQCSVCGRIKRKTLDQRIHRCICGAKLDRDINAAKNILNKRLLNRGVLVRNENSTQKLNVVLIRKKLPNKTAVESRIEYLSPC